LKRLDSRFCGNDEKRPFSTFYETVRIDKPPNLPYWKGTLFALLKRGAVQVLPLPFSCHPLLSSPIKGEELVGGTESPVSLPRWLVRLWRRGVRGGGRKWSFSRGHSAA